MELANGETEIQFGKLEVIVCETKMYLDNILVRRFLEEEVEITNMCTIMKQSALDQDEFVKIILDTNINTQNILES